MLRQMLGLRTGGAQMLLGRVREIPCAGTIIHIDLGAETPWEMDWNSDPFPSLMAPGSHDQGQTVKEGEQGSPLEETHSAG